MSGCCDGFTGPTAGGTGGGGGGGDLAVEDDGVAIGAPPFTTLNFIGDGVTAVDAGGGVADITIPGGGGGVYSPPEQWARNGTIAAGLTDVVLSGQVSTSFDDWQALVDGSVVRMGVRFTDAIVAGEATLTVTVNGVPVAALQVVCNSGSNPSGGITVVPEGDVPYVAGDLIGVVITTSEDPDFAPTANNVEVQLQIQDA